MKKLFFVLFLFSTVSSFACRFTIREIGYTSLNIETYQVRLVTDTAEYRELVKRFIDVAGRYSENSNVNYKIVHVDGGKPELTCVNSSDKVIASNVVHNAGDVNLFFEKLLYSPLQKMMYNQIGNVFAFVVGFYENEDKKTDAAIDKAFDQFRKLAPNLDKKVDENIMKIVVSKSKRDEEVELLKALNIDANSEEPVVIVIYGRGRLIGEPLTGKDITTHNILNQLVTLGTDCECGIDLSSLLQYAIPFIWNDQMNQEVFNLIGIDVENPIVLTEMSQILSKEPLETGKSDFSFVPTTIDLDAALSKGKDTEISKEAESSQVLNVTFLVLAVLVVLVLVAGIFILKRRKE